MTLASAGLKFESRLLRSTVRNAAEEFGGISILTRRHFSLWTLVAL